MKNDNLALPRAYASLSEELENDKIKYRHSKMWIPRSSQVSTFSNRKGPSRTRKNSNGAISTRKLVPLQKYASDSDRFEHSGGVKHIDTLGKHRGSKSYSVNSKCVVDESGEDVQIRKKANTVMFGPEMYECFQHRKFFRSQTAGVLQSRGLLPKMTSKLKTFDGFVKDKFPYWKVRIGKSDEG